jgi:O-acetyl-ADP-ribose deacetylase (regulator of RNase III)
MMRSQDMIRIAMGDITGQQADAIVNSANDSLWAGSGVCGAIHAAAGPELERACREIGGCPTGEAVITPGFRLRARFVIHAVGPRWRGGGRGEADLLERCYGNILRVAAANGIKSLAIPSISTGIYRFPLEAAAAIAMRVLRGGDSEELDVRMVCFDALTLEAYEEAMRAG